MWRFQAYGIVLLMLVFGLLSKYDIYYSRMASEGNWGMAVGAAILMFLFMLYIEYDMYRKKVESSEDQESSDTFTKFINLRNLLSIGAFIYVLLFVFTTEYTNDFGFLIALGVILYTQSMRKEVK